MAGVATDELDLFFAETYAVFAWDILMLQEGFVKTEGIQSDCKHVIYTPEQIVTGLRTPAIVVNEKCHGKSRLLSCGIRLVAVELRMHHITTIFVSVHLPHARAKLAADFQDTISSEIGSQVTIGTTQSVFLRYPGRTGRRFPDFMSWLMNTQDPV